MTVTEEGERERGRGAMAVSVSEKMKKQQPLASISWATEEDNRKSEREGNGPCSRDLCVMLR